MNETNHRKKKIWAKVAGIRCRSWVLQNGYLMTLMTTAVLITTIIDSTTQTEGEQNESFSSVTR
jgi:hypothetical protein